MNIIYKLEPSHIEDLHVLYQQEWWTKGRSLEDTKSCIAQSQVSIGLTNAENKLVAFARVLTDFTFKALIFDLIVRKGLRGAGFGEKLIEAIKSDARISKVKHIELYCLPEMIPYYMNNGFSTDVGGVQLMRLTNTR